MTRLFLTGVFVFLLCATCSAQQGNSVSRKPAKPVAEPTPAPAPVSPLKSSAAYAEVILRKTELDADLESLLTEFTDEYPKVKEARIEIELLQRELDRLTAVKPADSGKLTQALGKLMVRKVTLHTDLKTLLTQYDEKHPDVISARKKVQVFEKAIKDILGL
jgi:peptidoglycan hydrolase CwlO-like protein